MNAIPSRTNVARAAYIREGNWQPVLYLDHMICVGVGCTHCGAKTNEPCRAFAGKLLETRSPHMARMAAYDRLTALDDHATH